jgi:hypothetical protein
MQHRGTRSESAGRLEQKQDICVSKPELSAGVFLKEKAHIAALSQLTSFLFSL